MPSLAARLLPPWPILAILASAAMLAGAFAFEYIGKLEPCFLCFRQRDVYWGAIAIAVIGLLATRFYPQITLKRAIAVLLGLAFATGAIVALFHVGVEQGWVEFQCTPAGRGALAPIDLNADYRVPSCDKILWSWLGVSMAGWNALVSASLAAASFIVAASPKPASESDEA